MSKMLNTVDAEGDHWVGKGRVVRGNNPVADPNQHESTGNYLAMHLGDGWFRRLRQQRSPQINFLFL